MLLSSSLGSWLVLAFLQTGLAAPFSDGGQIDQIIDVSTVNAASDYEPADNRRGPKYSTRSEAHVTATQSVGGPHGNPFDDAWHASAQNNHWRIGYISLEGCQTGDHLSAITFGFTDGPTQTTLDTVKHGKSSPSMVPNALYLKQNEYVTKVEVTTFQAPVGLSHHTRVGWVRFTTDKENTVECGNRQFTDAITTLESKDGGLLYMSGAAGDAVDNLRGHFVPKGEIW